MNEELHFRNEGLVPSESICKVCDFDPDGFCIKCSNNLADCNKDFVLTHDQYLLLRGSIHGQDKLKLWLKNRKWNSGEKPPKLKGFYFVTDINNFVDIRFYEGNIHGKSKWVGGEDALYATYVSKWSKIPKSFSPKIRTFTILENTLDDTFKPVNKGLWLKLTIALILGIVLGGSLDG